MEKRISDLNIPPFIINSVVHYLYYLSYKNIVLLAPFLINAILYSYRLVQSISLYFLSSEMNDLEIFI